MPLIQVTRLRSEQRAPWECVRREWILAPVERVWRALTEPRELVRWLCDSAEVDLERGRFTLAGPTLYAPPAAESASLESSARKASSNTALVEHLAPARLEWTWTLGEVPTRIEIELEGHLEQTILTVRQTAEANPAWPHSDREANWWWIALPALRSLIEDGAPRLRLDYSLAGDRLQYSVPVSTFPFVVWTKLTDAKELRGWWSPEASIELEPGGAFRLGAMPAAGEDFALGPRRVLEIEEEEARFRLVHDWLWNENEESRVEWTIEETEAETMVRVEDHRPPDSHLERQRRAIHWASRLLDLAQKSVRGTAPLEYQDR